MRLLNTCIINTIISYDVYQFVINILSLFYSLIIIKFTLFTQKMQKNNNNKRFLLIDIIETLQFTHVYIINIIKKKIIEKESFIQLYIFFSFLVPLTVKENSSIKNHNGKIKLMINKNIVHTDSSKGH